MSRNQRAYINPAWTLEQYAEWLAWQSEAIKQEEVRRWRELAFPFQKARQDAWLLGRDVKKPVKRRLTFWQKLRLIWKIIRTHRQTQRRLLQRRLNTFVIPPQRYMLLDERTLVDVPTQTDKSRTLPGRNLSGRH